MGAAPEYGSSGRKTTICRSGCPQRTGTIARGRKKSKATWATVPHVWARVWASQTGAEKLNDFKGHPISLYQPMAYVELHAHKLQEQIYHVLEGEGLMDIDGEKRLLRKHDVIYLPPGTMHAIQNSGLVDLVFLVVTSPVTDEGP